jgi:hypothetical protein
VKGRTGAKGKALFMPLRRAITGRDHGPELAALLPLIGYDKVAARLSGVPGLTLTGSEPQAPGITFGAPPERSAFTPSLLTTSTAALVCEEHAGGLDGLRPDAGGIPGSPVGAAAARLGGGGLGLGPASAALRSAARFSRSVSCTFVILAGTSPRPSGR